MKSLKMMLSATAMLVASITVNAQTADDIISKHLDAIGGKEKLAQVKSIVIEATVNAMGNDAPAKTTLLVGKGFKTETEMMGQQVVQTVTDKGGWAITPQTGGSAQAIPDEQYASAKGSLYTDPFLDYAANGYTVELKGTEGGAYKLELKSANNAVTTYYIDSTTYNITKAVTSINMMGNDIDLTYSFSDFKKTDFGITRAYTTEIAYGSMFSMTSTVKTITINSDVDPKVFEMPK